MMNKTQIKGLYDHVDTLAAEIDRLSADRETNTPRKFRQWVSARQLARDLSSIRYQMYHVARAAEGGDLPDVCQQLTTRRVFERLGEFKTMPTQEADRKFFSRYGLGTADQFMLAKAYLDDLTPDTPALEDTMEYKIRALVLKHLPNFFPTPPSVALEMVAHLLPLYDGMTIWEPSAGIGSLIDAVYADGGVHDYRWVVCEINPELRAILRDVLAHYNIDQPDDIGWNMFDYADVPEERRPDRVLMNPPFNRGEDIEHVTFMWNLLKPGGKLVSIVSATALTNSSKAHKAFQVLVEEFGGSVTLDEGAFDVQPFPTKARAALVWLAKPEQLTPWDEDTEAGNVEELEAAERIFDDQPELARERALAKQVGLSDDELPNAVIEGRFIRVDSEQLDLIPEAPYEWIETTVDLDQLPPNERLISPPPTPGLCNDMNHHGMTYAVAVEWDGEGPIKDVVDGRRRVKAARALGWHQLTVKYAPGAPRDWLVGRAINLNAKRSANPLSEYDAIQELLRDHPHLTDKQIALGLGMPLGTVQKRLKLHGLYDPLLDVMRSGDMAVSTGEVLAGRTIEEQKRLWGQYNQQMQDEGKARITGKDVSQLREVTDQAAAQTLFDLGVFNTPDADPDPVGDWAGDVDVTAELQAILALADEVGPERNLADTFTTVIQKLDELVKALGGELPF